MRYRTIPALALLAATGALAAGCSSSASPSPSSSSGTTAPASTPSAPAAATGTGPSTSTGGGSLSAADCAVIKPIAAGAITTLAPLQTAAASSAANTVSQFIVQLSGAQNKVSSPQAKADLGALITALREATSNSTASQTAITTAITKLASDCS